eukprot:Rmarinus@m.24191
MLVPLVTSEVHNAPNESETVIHSNFFSLEKTGVLVASFFSNASSLHDSYVAGPNKANTCTAPCRVRSNEGQCVGRMDRTYSTLSEYGRAGEKALAVCENVTYPPPMAHVH